MQDNDFCLVADIGGTHARFALYDAGGLQRLFQRTLEVSSFVMIDQAIQAFLQEAGAGNRVEIAVLAVAGPVSGDRVCFTNSRWSFSCSALQQRFGWRALKVINDFEAVALGLDGMPEKAFMPVGGLQPARDTKQTRVVLGPGTGLGVAALAHNTAGPVVVAGEGGHARFAPATALEREVLAFVAGELPVVQREDLLSGRGLCRLHRAIAAVQGVDEPPINDPAVITGTAIGEPGSFCAGVLNAFCAMLGSVAADIALEAGATGGVYIAGGIVSRFPDFFAASPFRASFEEHPCMRAYLQRIPTALLLAEDAGMAGGVIVLRALLISCAGDGP